MHYYWRSLWQPEKLGENDTKHDSRGTALYPGEVFSHSPGTELHLTLASIEIRPSKYLDRAPPISYLVLKTAACENVICTLGKGNIYQHSLDLLFEPGEEVTFRVEGNGIVYITGYISGHAGNQYDAASQRPDHYTSLQDRIKQEEEPLDLPILQENEDGPKAHPEIAKEEEGEILADISETSDLDIKISLIPPDGDICDAHESPPDDVALGESQEEAATSSHRLLTSSPETTPCQILSLEDQPSEEVEGVPGESDSLRTVKNVPHLGEDAGEWPQDDNDFSRKGGLDETGRGWCDEGAKMEGGHKGTEEHEIGQREQSGPSSEESIPVDGSEFVTIVSLQQEEEDGYEEGKDDSQVGGNTTKKRKLDEVEADSSATNNESQNNLPALMNESSDEQFRCETCGKAFTDKVHLEKHQRLHSIIRPFKCQFCEKSYANRANVIIHERSHTGVRPFICQYCGKGFVQKYVQQIHERTHTGYKPHQCPLCGKGFSQKQHLTTHIRTHREDSVVCHVCNVTFRDRALLEIHFKTHNEDNFFVCTDCGQRFMGSASLKEHEKLHHSKQTYKCKICEDTFDDEAESVDHERSHSEVQPFPCTECKFYFISEKALKVHYRKKHIVSRMFKCQFCEKSYTQRANLVNHERSHTGEKPFSCKYCGKGFSMKYTCGVHERTHTGERPFKCNVCGKAFTQRGHMIGHKKIHFK